MISSVSGILNPSNVSGTTPGTRVADSDAFLKLLVAQLKQQDPTSPTDSTQIFSQLAAFSSVEQETKSNQKLDTLTANESFSQASALIGRLVSNQDGSVQGIVTGARREDNVTILELPGGAALKLAEAVRIESI